MYWENFRVRKQKVCQRKEKLRELYKSSGFDLNGIFRVTIESKINLIQRQSIL